MSLFCLAFLHSLLCETLLADSSQTATLDLGPFSQGVYSGTPPFGAAASCTQPGGDCDDEDNRVRSADLINFSWSIVASGLTAPVSVFDSVILEQTLYPGAGASIKFDEIPIPCRASPHGGGGQNPASTITQNSDHSITLLCNLGSMSNGEQKSFTVPVRPLSDSINDSTFSTVQKIFALDQNGERLTEDVDYIDDTVYRISAAPAWDLIGDRVELHQGGVVVDDVGTGRGPEQGVILLSTVHLAADATRLGKGVSALTPTFTFKPTLKATTSDGATEFPFEYKITHCVPNAEESPLAVWGNESIREDRSIREHVVDSGNCTISGNAFSGWTLTANNVDTQGLRYPAQTINGTSLAAGPYFQMAYQFGIFVPFSEIERENSTSSNGELRITNCLTDFDPSDTSGVSNYATAFEPGYNGQAMPDGTASNNCNGPLAVQLGQGGINYFRVADLTDDSGNVAQSSVRSGTHSGQGQAEPSVAWAYMNFFANSTGLPVHEQSLCTRFDNTTQRLASRDSVGATPGEYAWVAAEHGADAAEWLVEYASVDFSSDNPLDNNLDGSEDFNPASGRFEGNWSTISTLGCDDPSIIWHNTPTTPGLDNVNIVRAVPASVTVTVATRAQINLIVPVAARDRFYGGPHAGLPMPTGVVMAGFGSWRNASDSSQWHSSEYTPAPESTHWDGDRVTFTRVRVDIAKSTLSPAANPGTTVSVLAGKPVVWKLEPAISSALPQGGMASNVVVEDRLAKELIYDHNCTLGQAGGIAPDVVLPDTPHTGETLLQWHLGDRNSLSPPRAIIFCSTSRETTPTGTAVLNTATIKADNAIISEPAYQSIVLGQAGSLKAIATVKEATSATNSLQTHSLQWFNFSTNGAISAPTVISVLPFNQASNNTQSLPSSFHGSVRLASVPQLTWSNASVPAVDDPQTSIANLFYSADNAETIDLDPGANNSTWCKFTGTTFIEPQNGIGHCPMSLSQVSAIKAVSNYDLQANGDPRQGVLMTYSLLATDNNVADRYTSQFGIGTPSLPNQQFVLSRSDTIGIEDDDGIPASYEVGIGGFVAPADTDRDGLADYMDADSDNDGIPDLVEAGPAPWNPVDTDSDRIPDFLDLDSDNDSIADSVEAGWHPTTPSGTRYFPADTDHDGSPDYLDQDSDNDGVNDLTRNGYSDSDADGMIDNFSDQNADGLNDNVIDSAHDLDRDGISNALEGEQDTDGDGIANYRDPDADQDGVPDAIESGLEAFQPALTGYNNSATGTDLNTQTTETIGPVDSDSDGIADYLDSDSDNDGIPDNIEAASDGNDHDNDGISDTFDADLGLAGDLNQDGIDDAVFTQPLPDSDADGASDLLDRDSDNDGLSDTLEFTGIAFQNAALSTLENDVTDVRHVLSGNTELVGRDNNNDGVLDNIIDRNSDGFDDVMANTLASTPSPPPNADGDALPDYLDADSDQDGIPDVLELLPPGQGTTSGSVQRRMPIDSDSDGLADHLDIDSDNDGILDGHETMVHNNDNDLDGIDDAYDAHQVNGTDVNSNGVDDARELAGAPDADRDGLPNHRDSDSDNDGISDLRESGTSPQGIVINPNGALSVFIDSNGDGLDDRFSPHLTIHLDTDNDGVIDYLDLDSDNDSIPDLIENLPIDPADPYAVRDTDGDNIPDHRDLDSNNNGEPDITEAGLHDSNNDGLVDNFTDINSDGAHDNLLTAELDSDGDSIADIVEGTGDTDGDGVPDYLDTDSDGDTISDKTEAAQNNFIPADADADSIADFQDLDSDNDGISDQQEQADDTDFDGVPDYRDLDSDNDGLFDIVESQIKLPGALQLDQNHNGRVDVQHALGNNGLVDMLEEKSDSGTSRYIPADSDGDGISNHLDVDSDNDGLTDRLESGSGLNNLSTPAATGIEDSQTLIEQQSASETSDNSPGHSAIQSGVQSVGQQTPPTPNESTGQSTPFQQVDSAGLPGVLVLIPRNTDHDGVPDYLDRDSDNDGVGDTLEAFGTDEIEGDHWLTPGFIDSDNDGYADVWHTNPAVPINTDADASPDYIDTDSDADGLGDAYEAGSGDIDGDGMLDNFVDADNNGVDDAIFASPIVPNDLDGDSIPDMRDTDADNDGLSDLLESGAVDLDIDGKADAIIASGQILDLDANGIPDFRQNSAPQTAEALDEGPVRTGVSSSGCSLSVGKSDDSYRDPLFPGLLILAFVFSLRKKFTVKPRQQSGWMAGLFTLVLCGCATPNWHPQTRNSATIDNAGSAAVVEPDPKHWYVSINASLSKLDPDTRESNTWTVSDHDHSGGQIAIGADLNRDFSVEAHSASLGSAELTSATGNDSIEYKLHGASLLYYVGSTRNRDRRRGLTGYVRAGIGYLQNNAKNNSVWYKQDHSAQTIMGAALEYGTGSGFSLRAEYLHHQRDVNFAQLGLLYRFGNNSKQIPQASDNQANPAAAPVIAAASKAISPTDIDNDGVINSRDQCPGSDENVSVGLSGCALFNGIVEGIKFYTNSLHLTPAATAVLNGVADTLALFTNAELTVSAHTDSWGDDSYNQLMSDRRAEVVVNYLVSRGLRRSRLETKSYGETRPISSNQTAAGRALNRRVELFAQKPSARITTN